jgi:hypothetical protein
MEHAHSERAARRVDDNYATDNYDGWIKLTFSN